MADQRAGTSTEVKGKRKHTEDYGNAYNETQNQKRVKQDPQYQKFVKAQDEPIELNDLSKDTQKPKPKLLEDLGTEKWDKKAMGIMIKTGFVPGKGLGSNRKGIENPVDAGTAHEGRGLGYTRKYELEPLMTESDLQFKEEETIEKEIKWIPYEEPAAEINVIISGNVEAEAKYIIDDETNFCEPSILAEILRVKNLLDDLKPREKLKAVSRSNPYESIRKGIFINRAAMKMANIDCSLNFKITNFMETNYDLLYFADVCAGPGGFSEYVLYRKGWLAKGFGFTLKGDCDFKLRDFKVASTESFEAIYGPNTDSDGNVYNPINVDHFVQHVKKQTHNLGVHFMLADGGFSVAGQENIQEILSHQIYLSQCFVALSIVRTGGHFICKLFDVFTPFSVGLVYLFRLCFASVALHKPVTSRPANSERYLLCLDKLDNSNVEKILEYLKMCHTRMWELHCIANEYGEKRTIVQLVDLGILKDSDSEFFKYIYESNNTFGREQIEGLKKIIAFHRNENLKEGRQWETRRKFLHAWKILDGPMIPTDPLPIELLNDLTDNSKETYLKLENFKQEITSPYYWMCVPFECPEVKSYRTFYKSNGYSDVLKYNAGRKIWNNSFAETYIRLEMPKDTLVYGEIVYGKSNRASFYIIDAYMLGGKDISKESFESRVKICQTFAEAVCKVRNDKGESLAPIRVKTPVRLGKEYFQSLISRLKWPNDEKALEVYCPLELRDPESSLYKASGLLFLKFTQDPWIRSWSKSAQRDYYYNTKQTTSSTFDPPRNVYSEFKHMMANKLVWYWNKPLLLERETMPHQNRLNYHQLINYVQNF